MTLREKILQTFVVTMREVNRHGGPQEFFDKYPVGGLFYRELAGTENTIETGTGTNYVRLMECRKASKVPLLVCADYCTINGQKNMCRPSSLGASRNAEDAYNFGKMQGMQFNSKGVDWILAPAIDLLYDRSTPHGAITDDPEIVAEVFGKVVEGIQDQGVCATVKHFPGLGTNNINMHFGHGKNVLSFDEWMDTYGYIYKEMFKKNVMCVMTTHTSLKSYAEEYENGYYPIATFSEKLTTKLLKEELGFGGAVVTDALIMGGMCGGNLVEETVQAFRAGADLLLWPPIEAANRIEELILSGDIPMSRLEDALTRIQKLRDFRNKALSENKFDKPNLDFAEKTSLNVIRNGICEYKNEISLLPLNREKIKKILIIDGSRSLEMTPSVLLGRELEKAGFEVNVRRDVYDVSSNVCWQEDLDEIQAEYDLVIFSFDTAYISANESAGAGNISYMMIWASQLMNKNKKLIINYGSPFFAEDYFPEEHTIIEVNTVPTEATINFVVQGLLGEIRFTGKKALTRKE